MFSNADVALEQYFEILSYVSNINLIMSYIFIIIIFLLALFFAKFVFWDIFFKNA